MDIAPALFQPVEAQLGGETRKKSPAQGQCSRAGVSNTTEESSHPESYLTGFVRAAYWTEVQYRPSLHTFNALIQIAA